jgi:hypothetical protein
MRTELLTVLVEITELITRQDNNPIDHKVTDNGCTHNEINTASPLYCD